MASEANKSIAANTKAEGDGTSEESRKEQAAAEIMATLKPSSAGDQPAEEGATKTATTDAASKEMPQKKRKKLHASSGSSSSSSSPFRWMDDSEFVRNIAAEFKRRGYTVAMQLRPSEKVVTVEKTGANTEKETQLTTTKEISSLKEGESPPPSKSASTPQKPKAVATQLKNQPLALPSFPFYPSTVSITQKNADSWNTMFGQLQTYHAQNNGALPLNNLQPNNNNPLSKWTKSQLTLWKRMKKDSKHNLSLDRIGKLHSLNLDRCCTQMMMQLQPQQDVRNYLPVGGGDVDNDDANGGKMSSAGGEQMAMVMVPTGKNAQKWQDKFEELRKYKGLHGDTNVPRKYDDGLSKWCATQRLRCKEFMNGDAKTPMTLLQFQALESIGFDMSTKRKQYDRAVIDKKWEGRFNELLQYKGKHGNCDVAVRKGYEEYKQLANWAGLQRRKYKAKQTGTKAGRTTGITDDQIKKLASVGFSFSLQDDFDTRFKHLLEFKKEHGHTKVPVFYTGYNNLGRWAKRMRDGIRNNDVWMDDIRKEKLLGIDFDIAARHVFGHKPKKKSDDDATTKETDMVDAIGEVVEPVEAQAVAAATTMARMDNSGDYGRPILPPFGNTMGSPQFFYHGYPQAQP
ncbi:hypothetical protein ACHAXR_008422 [Thalassiosira sp. AJA248-18]